mgnify:CR=1 FL=1
MRIELLLLTEVALCLSGLGSLDTQTVLELTGDPFQGLKAHYSPVYYHEERVTGLTLGSFCMTSAIQNCPNNYLSLSLLLDRNP